MAVHALVLVREIRAAAIHMNSATFEMWSARVIKLLLKGAHLYVCEDASMGCDVLHMILITNDTLKKRRDGLCSVRCSFPALSL